MTSLTIDVNYIDAFEEGKHPRGQPGNKGEFAKSSGGGSSREGKFSRSRSESIPQVAARKGKQVAQSYGGEEHHVLVQSLARVRPEHRSKIAHSVASVGRAIPRLLNTKWQEEKGHAVHAAHGLRALATGKRPSPEQFKGLRSVGSRILLTGASAVAGDPSGSLGHLAVAFGHEAVHHVLMEHALKSMVGVGLLVAPKLRRKKIAPTHDADISDQDAQLLQAYANALAKAVQELDPAEIMKRIKARGTNGGT